MAPSPLVVCALRAIQSWDRLRLAWLARRHPGLAIHSGASTNLALARYRLESGALLAIRDGVVTERLPGALSFALEPEAQVEIGSGVWLRTEIEPVRIVAGAGARIAVGPEGLLNGCHLSAKRSIELGRRVFVGFGSRLVDSDQHDFDAERAEHSAPIRVGDHTWIAGDVTVLPGVTIGAHCVIGARSLVSRDVPDHTLAFGVPAQPRGPVGDRSASR